MVLREVFNGVRRFDDMQRHSGVNRQVLSNRLAHLVDQGILRRVPYQPEGSRVRHEYRLTQKGLDLYPVLTALAEWGAHYLADPEGPAVEMAHRDCGAEVHAVARVRRRPPGRRRPRGRAPAGSGRDTVGRIARGVGTSSGPSRRCAWDAVPAHGWP